MGIYDQLNATMADRDTEAYLDLLHEDCVFVFHKSGNEFSKSEWAEMVTGMMANDKLYSARTLMKSKKWLKCSTHLGLIKTMCLL